LGLELQGPDILEEIFDESLQLFGGHLGHG
jgi:hypothetical protein